MSVPAVKAAALVDRKPPVHMRIDELRVNYRVAAGYLKAVDGVSLEVRPGETIGLVGESGCGKSTVAKAILRLLPEDARVEGRILLDGEDVLRMSNKELRRIRWTKLAFITQSAMNSLDPVYRIGDQIVESILAHENVGKEQAWRRAEELFTLVGIKPARLKDYPHQFSGGMRQRAVIAMALSLNAGLLLADEPTTALDSIMQDQVLARIRRLQEELSRSMILVTHDMAVVAETCQTLAVMYAGKIIETGPVADVLTNPFHPYTMGLRNAFPRIDDERRQLISIPGNLPSLLDPPRGCRFASRCPFRTERCTREEPALLKVGERQFSACHYPDQAGEFRARAEERRTWDRVDPMLRAASAAGGGP
ncbi:MAG TPA: ABC transporter ATP-binding protein [Xanthobacteraceae bacterium]|nr:ABC transporter ATP-binding protein [Xanthobacteraceae bacterium]